MKKFLIVLIIISILTTALVFSGCNENAPNNSEIVTVSFLNWDGSILQVSEMPLGGSPQMPTNPQRADEGSDVFTFVGWDIKDTEDEERLTEITNVTETTVLIAVYEVSKVYSLYFIVDGEVYQSNKSGTTFSAPKPTKDGYVFDGWYRDENFESKVEVTYGQYRNLNKDAYVYARFVEVDD